jgi:hypothetical protein
MMEVAKIIADLRLCAKTGDAAPSFLCTEAANELDRLVEVEARAEKGSDTASSAYLRAAYRYVLRGAKAVESAFYDDIVPYDSPSDCG